MAICIDLVVGFHGGNVEIYSLYERKTLARFNVGEEMVNLAAYSVDGVVVYTTRRQFLLLREHKDNTNKYTLHQI